MSLLHIANNISSDDLPPCPVPDWTNMVVRAYTPEERQAIHDWYAVQDGNETIADMENRIPIKTQADLDRIYQIGSELFFDSDEIDEMVAGIGEMKRRSFQVQLTQSHRNDILS